MLSAALATARALRDTLTAEVERARLERGLLRTLDSDQLFASAAARAGFNAEVARLEAELARTLGDAARALGLEEMTIARLRLRAPAEAQALADVLADVRSLAGALAELDRLNLMLAGRALACVQAYLTALNPGASAYDRRGARTAFPSATRAAVSSKA